MVSSESARADAVDDAKDLLLANDYAGAYQKLQEPAARGDAEAQYQLATLYRMGLGVAADNAQALQWYQRAASQNHVAAQYLLATMYEKGLGTATDSAQALTWYRRAAANGSAQAQQKLAALSQPSTALDADVNDLLLHAARKGDSVQVATLLARGAAIDAVDAVDGEGNTALMLAAAEGNADSVELLLSKNAAVNVKNRSGDSALLLAANRDDSTDNKDAVRALTALLRHGADIGAVDSNGNNALLIAAARGNLNLCKQLLAQPSMQEKNWANAKNLSGDTALDLAKRANNSALAQMLAAAGIKGTEKTTTNPDTNTAVSVQVAAFAQHGDARYANWPALNIAVWRSDVALVDALIKQGAAIDRVDPENFTPLMRAVYRGDINIATRLLQAGADSNRVGSDQKTPLWFAIERKDSAMVELLLQRGAQPNLPRGAQPNRTSARADIVAFAAKNADEKILLDLLARASDIETPFADVTPLQRCAQRGFVQALQQLLAHHARIDSRDNAGRSALWLAAANNQLNAVELLLRASASSQHGAAPDLADREGVTPLAIAATRGNASIVDALIRNRADVDAATREGNTPLLLAARNARVEIINRLLAAKADIEHRNERSETALMLAAASGSRASIAVLLNAGADATRRDKNGHTAVDYARRHTFDDLAQRLQDHIDHRKKFTL